MKRNLQEALTKFHLQLNKKGVIVVFLSCILASLTGISIILCKTAYNRACIESADDMLHLAARSCMIRRLEALVKEGQNEIGRAHV